MKKTLKKWTREEKDAGVPGFGQDKNVFDAAMGLQNSLDDSLKIDDDDDDDKEGTVENPLADSKDDSADVAISSADSSTEESKQLKSFLAT